MSNIVNDTELYEKFQPLNVSSKFAICGLPLRMDTYKTCSFGCKYCFSNNREIMKFDKHISVANIDWLENKLHKVLADNQVDDANFLETLLYNNITFHCGGMSDPFQPCEKKLRITERCIDVCNKYQRTILFSTKSDNTYGANIKPEYHTFQLSVTGAGKDIEPNVPDISKRIDFFHRLKADGFRVGVRIQPFIPNISTLEIVKQFEGADNFTLEGIKVVPQSEYSQNVIYKELGLDPNDFIQMGLLNLKPRIRLKLYEPFIEYFEYHHIPYSIADNDLHYIGTNTCCCGDSLVNKSSGFDNTAMLKKYGEHYTLEMVYSELEKVGCLDCVCNQLFTSNRQEGCKTVKQFYRLRFRRASSPFSPKFLFYPDAQERAGQMNLFAEMDTDETF